MFGDGKLNTARFPLRTEKSTLFDMFMTSVVNFSENTAFIYKANKEEQRVSYVKLFEDVLLLSRAFQKRGIAEGDRVMLLSDNRYSWIVTDLALMSFGAVSVPRGSDTPTTELEFIIENSDSTHLVIESDKLLELHGEYVKKSRQLKNIFIMMAPELHTFFSNTYSFLDILGDHKYTKEDLKKFIDDGYAREKDELLTLIYTSGTTGMPKGVQLTHGNIMHNVRHIPGMIRLTEKDCWLSILPSWHIFERTAEYVGLYGGSSIVYSTVRTLSQDLDKYKPTLLATVPRVWESLYSKVDAGVRKKGDKAYKIFSSLISARAAYKRNKRILVGNLPVLKKPTAINGLLSKIGAALKVVALYVPAKLAESKLAAVQERFGGNLRLAISGGGSLAAYLEEWIDAVDIRIVNAYGMTECSPAIAGRGLDDHVIGTVGGGMPDTDIRIVDEEHKEVAQGEEGLIELRGEQVMPGYYKNDEENEKSFSEDGFFRTGDLGRFTIKRDLMITGRAKDIIVLSSGENIDPTRIESAITVFPFIQDAILVGQDKKGLGALLVADREELLKYANSKITDLKKTGEDILKDGTILDHIRKDMNAKLKPKQGFKPYEKLQSITFLDKEFKLGEELTNTLKKKRHVIEKKYKSVINDLLH